MEVIMPRKKREDKFPTWKEAKTGRTIEANPNNGVDGKTDVVFSKNNKVEIRLSLTDNQVKGLIEVLKGI